MTWLTEDPTVVLVIAGIAELVLVVVLFIRRLGKVLAAMGIVAALAALLVLIEAMIVTDREQVHDTLFALARAVERQDVTETLAHLSTRPETEGLRAFLERILPTTSVRNVRIINLQIDVTRSARLVIGNEKLPPQPLARAQFQAMAEVEIPDFGAQQVWTDWTLRFIREQDRWVLHSVERYEGPGENEVQGLVTP